MKLERSVLSGKVVETKQIEVNGVGIGVVSGYIATWEVDAFLGIYGVKDQILPGAYAESIQEHKNRSNRQVRLKDHHYNTIGGFPINTVKEDNVGLYGEGHINLETQQGREAYSLARQGVLVDFSVGHIVKDEKMEDGKRKILKAQIIEGSIVDEPKNQNARILEVKSFADLNIATDVKDWEPEEAKKRILEMKFADGNGADAFVSGHQIADFIDGKLVVIPEALYIAAEEVKAKDDKDAQLTLERYFGKMGVSSPFETKTFYTVDDVRDWTNAEMKDALLSTGAFSNGAARALVTKLKESKSATPDNSGLQSLMEKITATNKVLTQK